MSERPATGAGSGPGPRSSSPIRAARRSRSGSSLSSRRSSRSTGPSSATATIRAGAETSEEFESLHARLRRFATSQLFGCDFDPFLIRASQMNMVMAGDGKGHLYHLNSLEFPNGHLNGVKAAQRHIALGTMDVVMTNPPFGSEIPITDENILKGYDLAHMW